MTDHLQTAKIAFDDANASRDPETRDDFLFVAELNILASIAESLQTIAGRPGPAPESPSTPDPAPMDPQKPEGPQINAEPPEGSVVLDFDGDAWQRFDDTWHFADGVPTRWVELNVLYGPLTVIYRSDDTPATRAHRACRDAEMVAVEHNYANAATWRAWAEAEPAIAIDSLMNSYADGLEAQEAL